MTRTGYLANTNVKHLEVHQPSLCTDLGQTNMAMPFELHRYGASDISVTVYDELKRFNCTGSSRGLSSNGISIFAWKFPESPRTRPDERKLS